MAYQETTNTSYGQRLTSSFKGIATGFVMFIAATILLFWNEGNFVKTKKSIQEAEGAVVIVPDVTNINPDNNGKLIHATAFADTKDVLTDELFGVSETAITLRRNVEYYQWVEQSHSETKDKIGGGQETVTTYTYEKDWKWSPVESANFKDPDYQRLNFVLAEVDDKPKSAENVSFGGYKLPKFIISSISGSEPAKAQMTEEQIQEWKKVIAEKMTALGITAEDSQMVHVNGNVVYFGSSTSMPHIGDVRITFTKVMPADISIIAKVVNNTFEEYKAKNGKTFSAVKMGTVSAENMFADAHSENSTLTWIWRIVGILLVIGGLKSMAGFLPTLAKVLPFLGNIVETGVGLVCTILGGAWSLIIISLAWLFYRPLIGISLLLIAIAGIWFLNKRAKEKRANAANVAAT